MHATASGHRISIAVDDFGINAATNEAILGLVRAGRIDRVAVMTNGVLRPEEIAALRDSGVALDIHLDIDDDLREERSYDFLGRILRFLREYFFGSYRSQNAVIIWESQIEAFRRMFGRLPDGLNTHQHVHFFPPLFGAVISLAEHHDIRYVRLGRRSSGRWLPVPCALDLLRRFDRRRMERSGIGTSDYLVSADWVPEFDVAAYAEKHLAPGTLEAIYHPELPDERAFLLSWKES